MNQRDMTLDVLITVDLQYLIPLLNLAILMLRRGFNCGSGSNCLPLWPDGLSSVFIVAVFPHQFPYKNVIEILCVAVGDVNIVVGFLNIVFDMLLNYHLHTLSRKKHGLFILTAS